MRRKAVSADKCSVPILWMLFCTNIPRHLLCFLLTILDFCRPSTNSQQMYNLLSGQNRLKSRTCCGKWQPMAVVNSCCIYLMISDGSEDAKLRYTFEHGVGPSKMDVPLACCTMWGRKNKKITCLTCRRRTPGHNRCWFHVQIPKVSIQLWLPSVDICRASESVIEPNKTQHLGVMLSVAFGILLGNACIMYHTNSCLCASFF